MTKKSFEVKATNNKGIKLTVGSDQKDRIRADNRLRLVKKGRDSEAVDSSALSIIIINPNLKKPARTLDTLFLQPFKDFELLLVNAPESDAEVKKILKKWPKTSILKSPNHLGLCRARNSAARLARGKYLLFLANNAWLHRTALGKLVEALESEKNSGIVGPLLLDNDGKLISIGMNINQHGQAFANEDSFHPEIDFIDSVFFIPSQIFMVDRRLFAALHGFDELYMNGLEDADLCWRARLLGKKTIVNPWSIGYVSDGAQALPSSYIEHRNGLRMLIKNYGSLRVLTGCGSFIKNSVVKSFKSLMVMKPQLFIEHWRALFWNLIMLPDSMRQRRLVQRRRRLHDKLVLENMRPVDQPVSDQASDRAA